MKRRRVPTSRVAANEFTALHEGKPPSGTVLETIEPFIGRKRVLGRCTEVQYLKSVTDGTYPYHHPFAEHAQPTLFVDATGRPGFYRGRYKTTYRGIEDRTHGEIEDERLPGRATRLITLGKIQFLRYKWEDEDGDVKTEEIRFEPSEAPTLSHDQRGDLHLTGGRLLKEQTTMASKSGKSRSRRNPSGKDNSTMGRGKRILVTGLAVGFGATVTMVALNQVFTKFGLTWNPAVRAGAKVAAGVGLAMVAGMAMPGVPAVAAGLAVGGVVAGMGDLYVAYILPKLPASMGGPRAAQFPVTAGFPHLPAGRIPSGYGQMQGAGCGVG